MNPKVDKIPGLRNPSKEEQTWIAQNWKSELQQGYSPNGGKLIRYIGVFLICTSVVNLTRGNGGIVGMLMLLMVAAICFVFSAVGKKSSRDHSARLAAVETGEYLVAEATAVKVDSSERGNRPTGLVKVVLADGQKLGGLYRIPYTCARTLLQGGIQQVPVLLIVFSCDPDILAIPVEK